MIPSGKHTKNYGKSPFLMGKSMKIHYKWWFSIAILTLPEGISHSIFPRWGSSPKSSRGLTFCPRMRAKGYCRLSGAAVGSQNPLLSMFIFWEKNIFDLCRLCRSECMNRKIYWDTNLRVTFMIYGIWWCYMYRYVDVCFILIHMYITYYPDHAYD